MRVQLSSCSKCCSCSCSCCSYNCRLCALLLLLFVMDVAVATVRFKSGRAVGTILVFPLIKYLLLSNLLFPLQEYVFQQRIQKDYPSEYVGQRG